MTNKHTPGPWKARKVGGPAFKNQVLWAIDYNEDQEQVVDFVYEEADARLIAAAPDLLEALANLLEVVEQYDLPLSDPERIKARTAIAKARVTKE